jgi:murein DD-endopeptidase MepM/ murein hydrolase activator NlpD
MNNIRNLLLLLLSLSTISSCTIFNNGFQKIEKTQPMESVSLTRVVDTTSLETRPMSSQIALQNKELTLPSIENLIDKKDNDYFVPNFYPIINPSQKMRNDSKGDGHFGASRGRRTHNGLDLIVVPGSAVYCPIEGYMKRVAFPYGAGRRNKKWLGCAIEGMGLYRGYEVKIFYMDPFLMGEYVYPNDIIGKAQAISKKYSSRMIDHLHVEVRYKGQLIDPASLFKVIR